MNRLRVHLPDRIVELLTPAGSSITLAELLRQHAIPLNTRCGGRGLCEGCLVRTDHTDDQLHPACQRPANAFDQVHIPQRSLARFAPQVLSSFSIQIPFGQNPLTSARYGAAVDIGTTTIALLLIDLTDGRILSTQSAFNEQIHLGEDVLTRITYCAGEPARIDALRQAVLQQTVVPLLKRAMDQTGIDRSDIGAMTFAGNTTMLHLLVGEDPTSIGTAPFHATFLEHRIESFSQLLGPDWKGEAHLLPGASAYVGADIVAGVCVNGMSYHPGNQLLVDVGTNGEIVLAIDGQLLGCATAAGPAFEGAGLTCGMRAGSGAIARIGVIDHRPSVEIIGCTDPRDAIGICGSAYVDLLSIAHHAGWINSNGRLNAESPCVARQNGRLVLQLVPSARQGPIVITDQDIAKLLTAKAAIAAGIVTLLRRVHLEARDIQTLFLAGGFGAHLNVGHAITCGMFPGFKVDQVQVVGNTSLAGAMACLLDRTLIDHFGDVARRITPVELNLDPEFEDEFISRLSLPTDMPSDSIE